MSMDRLTPASVLLKVVSIRPLPELPGRLLHSWANRETTKPRMYKDNSWTYPRGVFFNAKTFSKHILLYPFLPFAGKNSPGS